MKKDILRKAVGIFLSVALLWNLVGCTPYSGSAEPAPTIAPLITDDFKDDGTTSSSVVGEPYAADFSLTMLDVGQGLSVLVQADGRYLLYDGGGHSASSYVVAYLQQHSVTELEWLVASHYDEDHIKRSGRCTSYDTVEASPDA